MFKVKGGKVNIFGRWVAMEAGSHSISADMEEGNIFTDGGGTPIVSYVLSEDGSVTFTSHIPNTYNVGKLPVKGNSSFQQRILSRGPLYEGENVTVLAEGFIFTFNYFAIANTIMAIKPFRWAGGRVCFGDMMSNGSMTAGTTYTAVPSALTCGNSLAEEYESGLGQIEDISAIYGGGGGLMSAAAKDSMRYYANATSIVYSYRTHRKYLFFASNVYGLYTSSIGAIGGGTGFPPGGIVGDPSSASFTYSAHSLRQ